MEAFAVNEYYVAPELAAARGIDTPDELRAFLETERIPGLVDLGVRWTRVHPDAFGSFSWGSVDPDRDGSDFEFRYTDVYLLTAQKAGIRVLPSLGPLKPGEWSDDSVESFVPRDLAPYREYVRALVERYDGDGVEDMPGLLSPIRDWQLDNEADLRNELRNGGYSGFESPAEYAQVLSATRDALRAADPESGVMVSLAWVGRGAYGLEYFDRFLGEGIDFDSLSYHIYPDTYSMDLLEATLSSVRSRLGDRAIWITEIGVPSAPVPGFGDTASEIEQAEWLVKAFVTHVSNGVRRLFWLSVMDMNPELGIGVFSFDGLVSYGPPAREKAAYGSFQRLAGELSDAQEARSEGEGIIGFRFSNGDRKVVAWAQANDTIDLRKEFGDTVVSVTRLLDGGVESVASDRVPVSTSPVLVKLP